MSIRDWFRSRDYGYRDFTGAYVSDAPEPEPDFDPVSGERRDPANVAFSSGEVIINGICFRNTEAAIDYFARKKETTMSAPCEHEYYNFVFKRGDTDARAQVKCMNPDCGMVFTDRYAMTEHAEQKSPVPKDSDPTYTNEQFAAVYRIMRNTKLRSVQAKEIENHLSYTNTGVTPEQLDEILWKMTADGVLESNPIIGDGPIAYATYSYKPCTRTYFPRPHMRLMTALDLGPVTYHDAKSWLKGDYPGYDIQKLGKDLLHVGIVEITETYDERKSFACIDKVLNEKESTIRYTPEIEMPPHIF